MFTRKLLYVGMVGVLLGLSGAAWSAPRVVNEAPEIVGAGAEAEPLIAIEASRAAIVDRIMGDHANTLASRGLDGSALRYALVTLRADQLLAAALVDGFDEVVAIAAQPVATGPALQRYVAVSPMRVADAMAIPGAAAYLVRSGDALKVESAASVGVAAADAQVVGYFVPATTAIADRGRIAQKDAAGTGVNSWIGYTSGGNVASGAGSSVWAGTFNQATAQGAYVGAGTSNAATGISSLVIGGFDNRATAIDALVGAGAGNRATGARSIVVGGGYNLASGQWSFIGGGGRDGTVSTAAGTDAKDNEATGKWAVIGGGMGNTAGPGQLAGVVGGHRNTASAGGAFVGGGGCNTASGPNAVVLGGGQESETSTCTFGNVASSWEAFVGAGFNNTASGGASVVPGGVDNTASGNHSFAAGRGATAGHGGSFVWSDSSGGGASSRADEFVVKAAGGVTVNSDRGISLNAVNTPIITRAWDPFDSTAAAAKQGIGRWGLFMEPSKLTIGIPGDDIPGRIFQVAKYALNGTAIPMLTVNQDGLLEIGGAGNYGPKIAIDSLNGRYIGNQNSTLYNRTNDAFAWYLNGTHSSSQFDPGTGGSVLATLQVGASTTAVTGTFRAQVFTATSDRNAKADFTTLSPKAILAKVAQLPIMSWSYKNEQAAGVRHVGPVSQDFKRLFNVGYDDKSIATVDADGIALAAIQGLKQLVDEKDAKISKLERELGLIKARLGIK